MDTAALGRMLIVVGVFVVLAGLLLIVGPRIPFLGRLPGDILVQRDGVTFFLPLATMIVLSVLLTIVINLAGRFFR
jgi:hypothetical protein